MWTVYPVLVCHLGRAEHRFTTPSSFTELIPCPGKLASEASYTGGVTGYLGETWVAHVDNCCQHGEWNECTDLYHICVLGFSTRLSSLLLSHLFNGKDVFHFLVAFNCPLRTELKLCHVLWLVWCFHLLFPAIWLILRAPWLDMDLIDTWNHVNERFS